MAEPLRAPAPSAGPLLAVADLAVRYRSGPGEPEASLVDGVSFDIGAGEVVALVGESGSGKTLTGRAVLGLLHRDPRMRVSGQARLNGRDLLPLPERELRAVRGPQIGMIFQDPVAALDPVTRIGRQIAEAIRRRGGGSGRGADSVGAQVGALLRQVGISDPELRMRQYPHEVSGGMCQRVLIAIALAGNPALLIADEPTTALDVTIQAQILSLLADLRQDRGMSVLLITHDMGVAARMADRVLVMYAGAIVEEAPAREFFAHPGHPYSLGLIEAVPRADTPRTRRLPAIPGTVPEARSRPPGCPFHPRCPLAIAVCAEQEPRLAQLGAQRVACHRQDDVRDLGARLWAGGLGAGSRS
jgi:oligopeptide/dipeptide ABC transporter ATP-binding protein